MNFTRKKIFHVSPALKSKNIFNDKFILNSFTRFSFLFGVLPCIPCLQAEVTVYDGMFTMVVGNKKLINTSAYKGHIRAYSVNKNPRQGCLSHSAPKTFTQTGIKRHINVIL